MPSAAKQAEVPLEICCHDARPQWPKGFGRPSRLAHSLNRCGIIVAGLGLFVSVMGVGQVSATLVGTVPRVASANPIVCTERAAPGPLTVLSTIVVQAADVGQAATIFLGALINNQLFLHNGTTFVLYQGGPLPAFMTNHPLAAVEQFTLATDIDAPPGTYEVGSGYQVGGGPVVFGAYFLKVASPSAGANPLDVCVTPDQSQAIRAVIPAGGGSVSATAADGTSFTLTLPPDALLSDEEITLTPVTAIQGLPLSGGLVAAVHLAPEGLRLFKPATLTIQVPSGFDAQAVTGFGYHEVGDQFHLYPLETSGSQLSMQVMHFSGYGVANGTAADRAAQQQRSPTTAEDRTNQRSSAVLDEARRQGRPLTPDDLDSLDSMYGDWLDTSLTPNLDAALNAIQNKAPNSAELVDAAIAESQAWLAGIDKVEAAAMKSVFMAEAAQGTSGRSRKDAVKARRDQTLRGQLILVRGTCFDPDPASGFISALNVLRLLKEGMALGGVVLPGPDEDECLRFTLHFSSFQEIDGVQPPVFLTTKSRVQATSVPLTLDAKLQLSGGGTLNYALFEVKSSCTINMVGVGGAPLKVTANLNANLKQGPVVVEELFLAFDPGSFSETGTVQCDPEQPPAPIGPTNFWTFGWAFFHTKELDTQRGYRIVGWEAQASSGQFTRQYADIKTVGIATLTEITNLNLIHTPQR